ncbi:hypothetical protein GCM10027418_22690 [Mariniluteicoccus endophyticus]
MGYIEVELPDGSIQRHVDSAQNGRLEARDLPDGGLVIVGVFHSGREQTVATYSAQSRIHRQV